MFNVGVGRRKVIATVSAIVMTGALVLSGASAASANQVGGGDSDPNDVRPVFPDLGGYITSTVVDRSAYREGNPGLAGYYVGAMWPDRADGSGGFSCPQPTSGNPVSVATSYVDAAGSVIAPAVIEGVGGFFGNIVQMGIVVQAPKNLSSPLSGFVRFSCPPVNGGTTTVIANLPLRIDPAPVSLYHSTHQWTTVNFAASKTGTIRAMGFTPGESVKATILNGEDVIVASTAVRADGAGAILASIPLPAGYSTSRGSQFIAAGATSRYALSSWTAPEDIVPDPSLTASVVAQSSAPSRQGVTVNLSKYAASAPIVIALHSAAAPIIIGTVTTNASGAVTATLPLPAGVTGSFQVWGGAKAVDYHLASAPITISAPGAATVTRLSGANRYDTSAAISAASFAPGVPVAYVASGSDFPDALSGAPVAGANDGPVLLTAGTLSPSVAAELKRLKPKKIVVLGGTGAVSASVASALKSYTTGGVSRLSGANRYDTSAAISAASFAPGVPVAYVASGSDFPDALSGAPVAGAKRGPVLLTAGTLSPSVKAELQRLKPKAIVVLGGTGAVNASVAQALKAYTTGGVSRLSGANRYDTSAAISAASFAPGAPVAYIANGTTFPDALSGAPVAGGVGGPVLLTAAGSLSPSVTAELQRLKPRKIVVLGGVGAVSDALAADLQKYVR